MPESQGHHRLSKEMPWLSMTAASRAQASRRGNFLFFVEGKKRKHL